MRRYQVLGRLTWRSLVCIAAWPLVALVPSTVVAQTGTVTGSVLASTGEVVPYAAVQWEGSSAWITVRGDGRFVLTGVPAGTRTVVAQALGYRTVRQTVDLAPGGTAVVDLTLETRPLDVAGISVSVLRPDLTPVSELEEREVREANPKDVGELLEGHGGDRRRAPRPAGAGPRGSGPAARPRSGTYLDGTRLEPAGPARMDSPLTHLDPSAVRSVEVIKGPVRSHVGRREPERNPCGDAAATGRAHASARQPGRRIRHEPGGLGNQRERARP